MILQPGGVWVVEMAPMFEGIAEALRTCHLRGWVQVIENSVPTGSLTPEQQLPDPLFVKAEPIYGLTSSGWDILHGTRQWLIANSLLPSVACWLPS